MTALPRSGPACGTVVALLAGGKGTRFWPLSRAATPKQFLTLFSDRSLLRLTFERFRRTVPESDILVVTNAAHERRTREEIPELPAENLILEPSGRDTAPAAALAVRASKAVYEDPVVIVAPTDHYIADEDAFDRALHSGVTAAERGAIVTFGVVPTRPATVYGYIEVGGTVTSAPAPLEVLRFHEKPGAAEAAAYLATGRFLWNAGIFAWRASVFERALGDADPALAARIAALPPAWAEHGPEEHPAEGSPAVSQEFAEAWNRLPAISVDYALLEKASGIRLIPLSAGWSDVGGWDAAAELLPADDLGNRQADATLYVGASDCSVHRLGAERLIALVGTEGIIVVETPDSVLVCKKGSGEALREVVRRLAAAGREDLL